MKPYQSLYHEWFRAPKDKKTPEPFVALIDALIHLHDIELMDANRGYLRGDNAGAPCLVFKAPIPQIKRINARLMKLNSQGFYHHWALTGKFDGQNQLFFRLSSPELDEAAKNNDVSLMFKMGWHRERIDAEIKRLTMHMNDMASH
ncbi:hypothetical protein CGK40_24285 [Vibrio parahaemolyticus]|uniref:hypothetical protein n=1 Tax=Vibrio parahaemolyticus TaxID=670 RepID=UPI00112099AB|nr:hypothetical protein [Vibrio parahaemolyticus]TNZ86768.1 hypothetical protein CGK40_24285 [Vibrio parahaemolyticus]